MKRVMAAAIAVMCVAACASRPLTPEQADAREAARQERDTAARFERLRHDMRGPDPAASY